MTDIGAGRPAQSFVDLRLERQDRQQVIDEARHPAAPCRGRQTQTVGETYSTIGIDGFHLPHPPGPRRD